MKKINRKPSKPQKGSSIDEVTTFKPRKGFLEDALRVKAREWLEVMLNDELDIALGMGRYERGDERNGYRKGPRGRTFTTSQGKHEIKVPRGAYFEAGLDGKKEFSSKLVPRYSRRTEEVEEALMMSYLSGTNMRRVKQCLSPLLKGAALSKSTVSRIVDKLSAQFETWRMRDISAEDVAIIFLDGFNLKMRVCGRVNRLPVLSAIGVRPDGSKVLLGLEVRSSESTSAWESFVSELNERGVNKAVLSVIDGNKGLRSAVTNVWPWMEVQRCTKHKLENLYTHAPKRNYEELKQDYHAIVYASDASSAKSAWLKFEKKWEKTCPNVVKSLNEAGDELLTFFGWPESMWKSLRTTNCIERLNEEFRRRVKTQGSLPSTDAGLKLLYGLFASGMITMNKIGGHKEMSQTATKKRYELGLIKALDKAA